jgi:DMSO/TMAO reductase YedYZ molybdopterin-dependent catalytic subunit
VAARGAWITRPDTRSTWARSTPSDRRRSSGSSTAPGGWYTEQRWHGVRLDRLLAAVGAGGSTVEVRSETGYARRFPLEEAGGFLLATGVADAPLDRGHGAPLRLVAPGRRGYDWVKWVTEIRVDDRSVLLQPPLPLQ